MELLTEELEKVRVDADFSAFITALKGCEISYYIHFVSTGNITFVKNDENFIQLKSNRYLLKVNHTVNIQAVKEATMRHFSRESNYECYCDELAKSGVFRWLVNLSRNERSYYSVMNKCLYTESVFQTII